MLEIIEAVNESKENNQIKLFLAGGITNCPDWQKEIIEKLENNKQPLGTSGGMLQNVTVFNPRRENFPIDDPNASNEQITWEYKKLRESDIIAFWFSEGSLNPIVLYEYGKHGTSQPTKIVVGCHTDYSRKSDVEIQTKLSRPEQKIFYDLGDFYNEIIDSIYQIFVAKNK
jgi:hypothetical protein